MRRIFLFNIVLLAAVVARAETPTKVPVADCESALKPQAQEELARHLARNDQIIQRSYFTTKRDFDSYQWFFGDRFVSYLHDLGSSQVWLDVGAGRALAMRNYLASLWHSAFGSKPKMIALGVTVPEDAELQAFIETEAARADRRFDYLLGRPIEAYGPGELPQVELITDVYGALSYAADLSGAMQRLASLLKPNGRMFIVISTEALEHQDTMLLDETGTIIPVEKWLRAIRGLELRSTAIREEGYRGDNGHVFELERVHERVVVPRLELLSLTSPMYSGGNPTRVYLWRQKAPAP